MKRSSPPPLALTAALVLATALAPAGCGTPPGDGGGSAVQPLSAAPPAPAASTPAATSTNTTSSTTSSTTASMTSQEDDMGLFGKKSDGLLEVGSAAPEFQLSDHTGRTVSLADYRGKRLLIWFYPKASTPG